MSHVEVLRRVIICDRNGKIKFDSGLQPSNSFVIAFLQHIYGTFKDVDISIRNSADAAITVKAPSGTAYARHHIGAGDNDDTFGLVVGTGTTPETNTDYALDTQIAHGTGAGQLDYGAHSFTATAVVGSNVDMVVSRSFYNGSGSSITVREIGIYCQSRYATGYAYFCTLRDVLGTPGVVNNTETLTLQYTFRTTV